jgi:hypothetical protein
MASPGRAAGLDQYVAALKQRAPGRGVSRLRRLLELQCTYPAEPSLTAVKQALAYGLFDLACLRFNGMAQALDRVLDQLEKQGLPVAEVLLQLLQEEQRLAADQGVRTKYHQLLTFDVINVRRYSLSHDQDLSRQGYRKDIQTAAGQTIFIGASEARSTQTGSVRRC